MSKLTPLARVACERLESPVLREGEVHLRWREVDLFVCQKQALVLAAAGECHDVFRCSRIYVDLLSATKEESPVLLY